MRGRVFAAILVILGALLFLSAKVFVSSQQKYTSATVFSKTATGSSIFHKLAESANNVEIRRSALLAPEDVAGIDTLVILAPRQEITAREAKIIANFVGAGGTAVFSFENEAGLAHIRPAAALLGARLSYKEDPAFVNRSSKTVQTSQSSRWFLPNERYTVYSRLILDGDGCKNGDFNCYVQEVSFGKGSAVILAGIPIIGNALIGQNDNRKFAYRLLPDDTTLMIDEYRHFFTEKTLTDLLLSPEFAVPILGLLLGALAFFAFSDTSAMDEAESHRADLPAALYHELNSELVAGLLRQAQLLPTAVQRQALFLERLFPRKKNEIEHTLGRYNLASGSGAVKEKQCFDASLGLARLHKKYLDERQLLQPDSTAT